MKTYVIHVSDAHERKARMLDELANKELEVEFITDGDKKTLNDDLLNTYFAGEMAVVSNATSCAYKHLLAYKKMAEGNDDIALILEDDIRFYDNYDRINQITEEISRKELDNFMISIEDSNLRYVPYSKRIKGDMLYRADENRLTGACLIDKKGAQNLLKFIIQNKIDCPLDWFHFKSTRNNIHNMYWSQPALAVQGSLDGTLKSLIDNKKTGNLRVWSFKIQRIYKKLIHLIR